MPSTDTLSEFGRTIGIKFSVNKLQIIKPIIGETKLKSVTNRRDEVVLHRARIGHTFLTHSYLLKKENSSDCSSCHCLLTVQHILIDCPNYQHIRAKYFTSHNLHDLFSSSSSSSIFIIQISRIYKITNIKLTNYKLLG